MAPLPQNNTGVLFIDYTAGGQKHSAEIRLPSGSNSAEAVTAYNAMKGPLAARMYTVDSITGARWRAAGSKLSFPLAVTPQAGSVAGTPDVDNKTMFFSFTGRGGGGRRCRFTWFTPVISVTASGYRASPIEAVYLAVLDALRGPSVAATDIQGNTVIWNNYVNFGSNAYFQRKQRRTG